MSPEELENEAPVLLGLGLASSDGLHLLELLLERDLVVGALAEEAQAGERLGGAAMVEEPPRRFVDERQREEEDGRGREAGVQGDLVRLAGHDVGGLLVDDLEGC